MKQHSSSPAAPTTLPAFEPDDADLVVGIIETPKGSRDPLDVLVLMDEPAFPGCRLTCRIVGVIEGKQGEKKDAERNDRLICVEQGNHSYAHVRHVDDLGKQFETEIEQFFVNYHQLTGKSYRILGLKGPAQGRRCVEACAKKGKRASQ